MRLLNWLIAKATPEAERDALLGDLIEEYEQRVRPARGPIRARLWYARQALLACAHSRVRSPDAVRPRPGQWIAELVRDLRHAARGLRRAPAFTLAAIVSLAVGIGASTAIFSVANPILFQPAPYPDGSRIMMIWYAGANGAPVQQAFGTYRELVVRSRTFASIAATRSWQPTLTGAAEPERLEGQQVTAQYFQVLGVLPAGPGFDPAEDRPGGANVVVISDGLWRRRFGADPAIVGQRIALNDVPGTVVGVMPAGFEDVLSSRAEIWSLLQFNPALPPEGREWGHQLRTVGRLNATASIAAARDDLARIAQNTTPEFARPSYASMAQGLIVAPLGDDVAGPVKPLLVAVMGGVGLLLAIACLNVTNLLVARGSRRHGEVALRAALGAGRGRLARQFVAESVLVAFIGGAGGLLVGAAGVRALVALGPVDLPRVSAIRLDASAFLFCAAIALLIGVVVGLAPAVQAVRADLRPGTQRGTSASAGSVLARRLLVVLEVTFAGVLLVGAGLLFRSVDRLFGIAPGFETSHVVTMQVQTASRQRFPDTAAVHEFYNRAIEAVKRVPGVTSAAFTSQLPLSGDSDLFAAFLDRAENPAQPAAAVYRYAVTPEYFDTMRIPVRRGRPFDDRDKAPSAERPVIINAAMAAHLFPNADPVGQRIRMGGPRNRPWDVIVGVVGDVKQESLASDANAVYAVADQWLWPDTSRWLVARATGNASSLAPAIKAAVWSVDKEQPIVRVASMDDVLARSAGSRRFALLLFEAFALVALVLAATGLYGVLSGSVTARTREIGVRSALGATRPAILSMIFREGLTLTVVGAAAGLAIGAGASVVLTSLLFQVSRLDVLTYIGVAMVLAAVSVAACWLPAWRAARVDPLIALRSE